MEAKLYYRWSRLDKCHEFALITPHKWIWYYLGAAMGKKQVYLYPFLPVKYGGKTDFKLLKHYKNDDSEETGRAIAKRIKSKIK